MAKMQRIADPTQLKVQLNVKVTWEFREHLTKLASQNDVSLNHMLSNALMAAFPMHHGES